MKLFASNSAGASKIEGVAEEECKRLKKNVSELNNKLQISIDELKKNKEKNSQLEKSIRELQKQHEQNQKLISQLTKERESQDFKIAKMMSNDINIEVKSVSTSQPAKGKEKALEENKTISPSKMVTPKKESKKVNITANYKNLCTNSIYIYIWLEAI